MTIKASEIQEAERVYKSLHGMVAFNTIITKTQAEYILDKYSDLVFCNGHLRKVKVEPIMESRYKIYTEAA